MNDHRDGADGRSIEGFGPGERLEDDHAEQPDVRPFVETDRANTLLRAHVVRRAHDETRHRSTATDSVSSRRPEVEELDEDLSTFRVAKEDVLRLDVLMDDRGFGALSIALRRSGRRASRRRQAPCVRAQRCAARSLPSEQLHHDVRSTRWP